MGIFFDSKQTFEILEEASINDDVKKVKSEMIILYGHMLKLKYQKERYLQSYTWINSIVDSSVIISKTCRNTNVRNRSLNEQYDAYKKGIELMVSDTKGKLTKNDVPNELPPEWELPNIINIKFIFDFMDKYTMEGTSAYKHLQIKREKFKDKL